MNSHNRSLYVKFPAGFTLVEFVAVISIVSILAIMAYPLFTSPAQFGLNGAIHVIESDIKNTQISAMASGEPRSLVFSAGAGGYSFNELNDGSTSTERNLKEIHGQIVIESGGIITFNSIGEPAPSSLTSVTIKLSGMSKTVTINPFTGKTTTL